MVKRNSKRTRETSIFLAILFTGIMLLSFVSVWAIDYDWNNYGETELLYSTDGSTQFITIPYANPPDPYFSDLQTGHRVRPDTPTYWQFNQTPVYQGSDHWMINMNDTGENFNYGVIVIDMPNLDDWIIDDITINMTENNDISYLNSFNFGYYNNGYIDHDIPENQFSESFFRGYLPGGSDWSNRSADLSMGQALSIRQNAELFDQSYLEIYYYDDGADYDGWLWSFKVEITGSLKEDISLEKSVAWAIGGSSVINIVAVLFMTDSIDINPRKDLKRYRRK